MRFIWIPCISPSFYSFPTSCARPIYVVCKTITLFCDARSISSRSPIFGMIILRNSSASYTRSYFIARTFCSWFSSFGVTLFAGILRSTQWNSAISKIISSSTGRFRSLLTRHTTTFFTMSPFISIDRVPTLTWLRFLHVTLPPVEVQKSLYCNKSTNFVGKGSAYSDSNRGLPDPNRVI